jgi:hypothetical protein
VWQWKKNLLPVLSGEIFHREGHEDHEDFAGALRTPFLCFLSFVFFVVKK